MYKVTNILKHFVISDHESLSSDLNTPTWPNIATENNHVYYSLHFLSDGKFTGQGLWGAYKHMISISLNVYLVHVIIIVSQQEKFTAYNIVWLPIIPIVTITIAKVSYQQHDKIIYSIIF